MITKTKPTLHTVVEWFHIMERSLGCYPGLTYLEQAMKQSERYHVCVECLGTANLVHETGRELIKGTDYYMCQDCLAYWATK